MIPYFGEPVLWIGSTPIHVFSLLLILAVLAGGYIILKRAARLKINHNLMFRMSFWAMVCGVAGAHAAKMAMDHTPEFLANPWIVFQPGGIRSAGGLCGGLLGALGYCRLRRVSFLETFRMLDVISFALPFAWAIGRLGCFLVHDHRGNFTTSWIAVRFPEGPRYDLGLIEFLFLIILSAVFYWLDRRPRPVGFFFGLYAFVYGAFRVWLDTLHFQPFRFFGGALACLVGLACWMAMRRFQASGKSTSTLSRPAF